MIRRTSSEYGIPWIDGTFVPMLIILPKRGKMPKQRERRDYPGNLLMPI